MTRMFVSIYEKTAEAALQRLVRLPREVAGAEIRVDAFSRDAAGVDLTAFRNATDRRLIYTRRTAGLESRPTLDELSAAAAAGFDIVDAEFENYYGTPSFPDSTRDFMLRWPEKVLLSLHDFEGVPAELGQLVDAIDDHGPFKIAVAPRSFEDNLLLLRQLERFREKSAGRKLYSERSLNGATIFGMGARGLYSRILAPFFGSELQYVAADASSLAAPGQLTVDDAVTIYGGGETVAEPRALFAVVGNPAAHSRSPLIHNRLFRERRMAAAYSIIETERFDEVAGRFFAVRRDPLVPVGLSVTAPFKEAAFQAAVDRQARVSSIAARARAVNTLVRLGDSFIAENTDVSGFMQLLQPFDRERALVLGAGGTARAALVALEQLGFRAIVANRDEVKGQRLAAEMNALFLPLRDAESAGALVVIDTIPASSGLDTTAALCQGRVALTTDYTVAEERLRIARERGVEVIDGMQLLQAQAVGQASLFIQAVARVTS